MRCQLLPTASAVLTLRIACDFIYESGLQLTTNTSLQRLDIRVEPIEEAQGGLKTPGLTNLQHTSKPCDDMYPAFLRTWQNILRTIPSTVWRQSVSFRLNVMVMPRKAFASNVSRPVIRTLRLAELTDIVRRSFSCRYSDLRVFANAGRAHESRGCHYVVMDAADYWDHLKRHMAVTIPEIRICSIAWGVVRCELDGEILLATPPAVARHYRIHHPIYCPVQLLRQDSPLPNGDKIEEGPAEISSPAIEVACTAPLEPSPMAFVKHFRAWHCYRNTSIALKDDSLPGLRQSARKALKDRLQPWYSLHERVAQLRASAAPIDDKINVMKLSRNEVKAHLELLSYHDPNIQPASYLDICGQWETKSDASAKEELAKAIMRAQRMYSTPDIDWMPA